MSSRSPVDIFEAVVANLERWFPEIRGGYTEPSPAVDRAYEMRKQEALVADVLLNLQNQDELHLCIGPHFWCEWFPCFESGVADDYTEAIEGFLAGRHRVLDSYRGDGCFKSVLQTRSENRWKTIATSRRLGGGGWPWSKRRQQVIRNREQAGTPNS